MKAVMLQPFNHAEMMNQATTFFGAKHALKTAIRSGQYEIPVKPNGSPLAGQELEGWLNFEAGNIVNSTQFRPGAKWIEAAKNYSGGSQ